MKHFTASDIRRNEEDEEVCFMLMHKQSATTSDPSRLTSFANSNAYKAHPRISFIHEKCCVPRGRLPCNLLAKEKRLECSLL